MKLKAIMDESNKLKSKAALKKAKQRAYRTTDQNPAEQSKNAESMAKTRAKFSERKRLRKIESMPRELQIQESTIMKTKRWKKMPRRHKE